MITLFLLLHYLNGQPCATPVTLINLIQTSGVCTPPVPGASLLKYPFATLGATTENAVKFSVAFWLRPPSAPTLGGKTYGILWVSTDTTDTIPTTTEGIRLAVYFSLDSVNRGFYLGYSESPSDPILYTDITQMSAAYTGDWMFIYAGLDYTIGELKISTWEFKQIFWQQKKFSASKVNFNTPLSTNTAIEALYWGSQDSFCGDIKKLKWMPNYYETIDENIFKLAYFLENKVNAGCYLYRFDKVDTNTVTNLASSGTLTLQQNMQFTYYELDLTNPVLDIPIGKWTTSTSSYTFGTYILQKSLPQFAADIILFQRLTAASANLFSIKLALQSNGKLGIVLTLEAVTKLLVQFDCQLDQWYLIQISVAFAGSLQSQTNTLSHYHIVAQDGSILSGYVQIAYTATISTKYTATDTASIGDTLNPYQGIIQLRLLRFEEGFQIFMNSPCQTDCTIGRYSLISSENYCYVCSLAAKLDSTFLCSTSPCSANYYMITDMTSHNFCAFCDSAQSYYVNPSQVCIQAACGNGYKEPPGEDCDDAGVTNGDGCSATCVYEKGYNCSPATDYELTTCVIYCGNGVRDEVLAPPALSFTEACDDGNNVLNDGCSLCAVDTDLWECGYSFPSQCTQLCGNGKLNNDGAFSQTEQCDDGNISNGDGCDSTCQIEPDWLCSAVPLQMSACILICGNGTLDAGEQCDDGNVMDFDGCTGCVIDAGWDCSGTICTQYCGNGTKDVIPLKSINEICDDGNTIQYDGCYQCLVEVGWTCDASNPSQCHMCGNSKKEPYETCDDGNTVSLDGCSSTCQTEPSWTCNGGNPDICNNCGDGKKQQIEDCDDGNLSSNDGCTSCKVDLYYECSGGSPTSPDICVKTCPNGVVSGSEECDDGNNTSGDGCYLCIIAMGFVCDNLVQPSVCTIDICGNGKSHSLNEECDDGNIVDGDGCSASCKIETGWDCSTKVKCSPICGDSKKVNDIEECDDGNLIDGDGCSSNCKVELSYTCEGGDLTKKDICIVTCGNNIRDVKEECDDGNVRNGDGCSSLCLIETSFGCSQVLMQDNVTRDECYPCITNCAMCTDTDIEGCQLCYHGYYKAENSCTDDCGDKHYADPFMQACLKCGDNCMRCYNNAQCFRCESPYVLDGTQCVQKCSDGYYIKEHELKGEWCKKCPIHCTVCETETLCTSCEDYYSPFGSCKFCDMGDLCLACDFELNTCIKCKLGYRPIEDKCIKIEDKCGDSLVSNNEKCDDGNLANGDGCSRECIIEDGANCRLVQNEGPSECFDTLGWEFELKSFILDPQLIQLTFTDQIKYDDIIIKNISTLFTLSINGFTEQDYSYQFVNNSGSNKTISIQFTFLKNVVSQTLTVTLKDQKKLTNYYDVAINPDKITKSIDLEDKEFYNPAEIEFFTLLRNLAYGLQILNWILMIGAGFLDQQYRIWKTIEILQVICTLYYINLRSYPLNSEMLLIDLRYSNLYILPNFLQQYTDEYLQSLRRFSMAGLTYQVINNTGGLFLFYLAISFVIYAFTKLVYHRYVFYVFEVFLDKLEFSYFFKFYEVFLLELLISCLHNVKFNSMASNWSGTNTVIALILLLFIILVQASFFLLAFFRDYFGTEVEVKSMFGTLTDGCHDHDRKRRVFMSQQDFIKKAFIAYAMIYVDDPFQQILLIIIPRAVIGTVTCLLMKDWFLRIKEIFSELLLYGIISQSYILALGDFVGDLDKKVFYGSLWVYMVLAFELVHGLCNTYLVWRLLYVLESTLPEDIDPNAGINTKIDLFKQRGEKKGRGKTQRELQEEADRLAKLEEAKRKKKLDAEQALKNQNREKWNVWNMQREAKPEERKFVSVKHNEYGDVLEPIQPSIPKLNLKQNDDLNNFDDFDQMENFFGNPSKSVVNQSQAFGQTGQQFKVPSLNQTQQMNQTQQKQMNQTINQSINQNLNQTKKSENIAQQWLGNDTQQPLFQEQSFKPASAAQQQQKSQISAFQFQQEAPPKKDAVNDSEQESMNNDNPFDF